MSDNRVRVVAVVNPAAGGSPESAVRTLRAHPCIDLRTVHTTRPGDGERLVARESEDGWAEVVVAVGGDGTVAQVATGLYAHPGTPLLIAPAGTGNSNYRGLCDDRDWADVVDALATGTLEHRRVDLAVTDGVDRVILLGTTTGLLPTTLEIAQSTAGTGRDLLSRAAIEALTKQKPYPARVSVDGEIIHSGELIGTYIGGMRHRGGRFEMLPDSLIDDGQLDVCLLSNTAAPRYGRGAAITVERTDSVPLLVELDGELAQLETPSYTVRVLSAALEVLVPTPLPPAFSARSVGVAVR
ncbi:diacylglycerol/lipid kinase family protein [Rhodococcus sp. NPDC003318]|uniref:diacylglycerol/lipid kinase family protein n=1 Tax=Rhodococcus sp. NPDC003318 TaxID=3364503 RepID=UPI00369445C6